MPSADEARARDWLGGDRLAVSLVVNVEEGAQLSIAQGDERNEAVYEVVEGIEGVPDPCMDSHFDYGAGPGWARIRKALRERGLAATLNACGRALRAHPHIAREAVADGHEVAAHGWRWERHAHMSEAEERRAIGRTVAAIAETAGTPPVGWHTRSATSVNTRRLLLEQGGFLYDSNAYDSDTPYLLSEGGRDHVVLPYAFDTNDMRFQRQGGFVFAEDFARYGIAAFERLFAEGAEAPRMLSIGLHLRIIGRPARIGGLEALLDHIVDRPGVRVMPRAEIAHAWRAAMGLDRWAQRAPLSDFPRT
ncbi:MAG: polysaccharide deacetylase family protein [Pseudomonadota bacterium]